MTFYVENETDVEFDFSVQEVFETVCRGAMEEEKCKYDIQVNLVLTDAEGIRELNRETRGIDKETDVLSFPNLEYDTPGVIELDDNEFADCSDPDTEELILGDIMINVSRVISQAEEFGHSRKREFAFLVAHSMLHLFGYDHMEAEEAKVMEEKQELILQTLGITRD